MPEGTTRPEEFDRWIDMYAGEGFETAVVGYRKLVEEAASTADAETLSAMRCGKRHFLRHLYIECVILPRQARDKHRENSNKKCRFPSARTLRRHASSSGTHTTQQKQNSWSGISQRVLPRQAQDDQLRPTHQCQFVYPFPLFFSMCVLVLCGAHHNDNHRMFWKAAEDLLQWPSFD